MIRIHYLDNGNVLRDDLSPEAIPDALSMPGGMLWVDVPIFIPIMNVFIVTPLLMCPWMRRRGWM